MIKLSLNSPEVSKQQTPAAFANTLAAAVEAAGAQPVQTANAAGKKQPKQAQVQLPSNGLLSRSVRWMQQKGRSKKRMQMIETVSLGEKRFVALVKVDGREFLLGGAPSSVGMLADLGAHGLGNLLNLPAIAETQAPVAAAVALEPPAPVASVPPVQSQPLQLPKASVIEPMTLPLPTVTVETVAYATPVEPARVDVTVEADEDESDWLLQDDLDTMFKSSPAAGPRIVQSEPAKVLEIRTEPVQPTVISVVEQPAAVIVTPTVAAPATHPSFASANFTFQMWPAIPIAATVAPMSIAPAPSNAKAKTGIDLQSCPELLGEPYLLALVEKSRGAAA